jgi:oxygen-dependent protoporphyrinogen oxidase
LEVVQAELRDLLGASGAPAFVHLHRWPRAIPQYVLGHGRILDACAEVEASAPGLFIGGNFRDGISVANCIESGQRLAAAAQGAFERSPASLRPSNSESRIS